MSVGRTARIAFVGLVMSRGLGAQEPAKPIVMIPATVDSTVVDTVAPGVEHWYVVRTTGPWRAHAVRIDYRSGRFAVRSARALDSLAGRETVSGIVARQTAHGDSVVAGINADFFDLKTGESINNQVQDSRVWRAVPMTAAPAGAAAPTNAPSARAQFAVTRTGRLAMERFVFGGIVRAGRAFWSLDGVNAMPANGEGLVLWGSEASGRVRGDSLRHGRQVLVSVRGSWRDSLIVRPLSAATSIDSAAIAANTAVLVGYGAAAARLDSIVALKRAVAVRADWIPSVGAVDQLIGGWPMLLRDGAPILAESQVRERTGKSNTDVRHPRSFVGFDADSSHLWLIALDGRSALSTGVTLAEATELLRSLGVATAMNLDGGGSTALVLNGKVANHPSDAGGERSVANALLIVRKRR